MGAIGGILGLSGGVQGTGYNFNQSTINNGQVQQALGQSQQGMGGQAALLSALQGQNGLTNQSNVYNQLSGVAAGTGPNPAQAMLNQQTGQNIAAQGALMAGQRGAAANPALMARQAAQEGGALQQQAVGQGAAMQAQQSLNALGSMGNMANTQAGQQIAQTNTNQNAQAQQLASLLSSNTGMQSNLNNIYGQLANTNIQGQQGMIGNQMNSAGQFASSMMKMGGARGGEVPQYAEGAEVQPTKPEQQEDEEPVAAVAPASSTPTFAGDAAAGVMAAGYAGKASVSTGGGGSFNTFAQWFQKKQGGADSGGASLGDSGGPGGSSDMPGSGAMVAARGGEVPVMLSPGEKKLSPSEAKVAKQGANPMAMGETVPGTPKVGGAKNDYANDTQPDMVEPGTIILPRSVTQAKDPVHASIRFMRALQAKKGKK